MRGGLDSRLEIGGLQEGQVTAINVVVQGGQVALRPGPSSTPSPNPTPSPSPSPSPRPTPSPDDEVEFNGTIQSISAPNLVVSGRLVRTDGNTRIRRSGRSLAFGDLQVGQSVEVEGRPLADNSVQAQSISVEDGPGDDEDDVSFTGRVDSVSPPSLRVAGRLVVTDSSTRIEAHGDAIPLASIKAGDRVEVEGSSQADGSVRASKVHLED